MRRAIALALLVCLPAFAQDAGSFSLDAGTPDAGAPRATFYRIPENTRIDGLLPAGFFLTDADFAIVDNEMKRLQAVEQQPKDDPRIPVEGYLIGMAINACVFVLVGMAIGAYLGKKL